MAPNRVPVTVKFSKPGVQPPVYLAGSFSDPAWQPQEMQHTTESAEYMYKKEVEVEEGKEYQYKFRIGEGDWWVVDDNSQIGMYIMSSCRIHQTRPPTSSEQSN